MTEAQARRKEKRAGWLAGKQAGTRGLPDVVRTPKGKRIHLGSSTTHREERIRETGNETFIRNRNVSGVSTAPQNAESRAVLDADKLTIAKGDAAGNTPVASGDVVMAKVVSDARATVGDTAAELRRAKQMRIRQLNSAPSMARMIICENERGLEAPAVADWARIINRDWETAQYRR
ncbi:hypothetical protein [Caballeronia sordidicola]|uniref:hypothetical protein n=1 Tax=Caballeronia sordidicola TaxID=196367 RepID=UPI000B781BB0|nr:hypothetical protein [Caballeronia sordidicola]